MFALIGPYNSSVGIQNLPLWISAGVIPIHLASNSATNGSIHASSCASIPRAACASPCAER